MNDKHIFLKASIDIPDIYFDNKHLEIDADHNYLIKVCEKI